MIASSSIDRWLRTRTFHHAEFPPERIAVERDATVSVCVPAKDCGATIGPIVTVLAGLVERGVVDEVLVIDAGEVDGTDEIVRAAGLLVLHESELLPAYGPIAGKGDVMWRSLPVLTGDVVVYVDGDTTGFGEHFVCGIAGPVVCEPGAAFAKAFYRRPFQAGDTTLPHGGGRVTELTAKPLLRRFWPELAGFHQPLAGELAARRGLLERLPFATGYGVEMAMLIDAHAAVGLRGLAQVDLDVRQNAHQSLEALGAMADDVLEAGAARLQGDGRLAAPGAAARERPVRPPIVSLPAARA